MAIYNKASDISDDGKTELFLYWRPNGPLVDVSIYIHEIPSGKKAVLTNLTEAPHEYVFEFHIDNGGNIISEHTEYFEYQLPPPQQDVTVGIGSVSKANAVAL